MHGGDSLFSRMSTTAHVYRDTGVDPELDHKAHRVTEKLSESINTIANEPSVAFYRIQEHVRKTLPQLVEQKHEVEDVQQQVQGACFDTEYAGNAVKMMQKSVVHFQNIQELLKNAMFMKQQIDYEEARRRQSRTPGTGGRQEESGVRPGEEGPSDMVDSAVSTDSSLVASPHANTEASDGDCREENRQRLTTSNETPEDAGQSLQVDSTTEPPRNSPSHSQTAAPQGGDIEVAEDAGLAESWQPAETTQSQQGDNNQSHNWDLQGSSQPGENTQSQGHFETIGDKKPDMQQLGSEQHEDSPPKGDAQTREKTDTKEGPHEEEDTGSWAYGQIGEN